LLESIQGTKLLEVIQGTKLFYYTSHTFFYIIFFIAIKILFP
jgi:hypothetical protein